jgi:DNA-binding MarR family transcriptional regulator
MSIEKDIAQPKFRNVYQKALVNFIFTHHWLNERMSRTFDREAITGQQFNILRILRGAGKPLSTLQIRNRMLDRMSDTSRIVDRLIIKGLVKKDICPTDKRKVDVSITTEGLKLLERLDLIQDEIDGVFNNLNESEAQTLNQLLDKIRSSDV